MSSKAIHLNYKFSAVTSRKKFLVETGKLWDCKIKYLDFIFYSTSCGFLSPRHGASPGSGWRRQPPDMECTSSRGQPTTGSPPVCGLGEGLTSPHRKRKLVTKCYTGPLIGRAYVNTVMKIRVP